MDIYVPVVFKTTISTDAMPMLKKHDEIRIQWASEQSLYEILDTLVKSMNTNATFATLEYIKPVNTTESSASFQIEKEVDWEDELNHLIKQYQEEESNESDGLQ
jgi:molybdopterin-biosynthesis enzyme MoeA-like protein